MLRLVEKADAFVEAFRPGVTERLGIGPDVLLARNPRIVYGRLTGWGQDGPLSPWAGHSLNYEAITGAVGSIGVPGQQPPPLLQVLGDFGGGGMHMAFGVVCALFESQRSGQGQVVDVSMTEGVMSLYSVFYAMTQMGVHDGPLGSNLFDGGSPFYNTYGTSDDRYITLAPIEPKFYAQLLERLGLDPSDLPAQYDESRWPELNERIAEVVRTRTRDEWTELLEGTDVCFAPVLRSPRPPSTRTTWPVGRSSTYPARSASCARRRLSRTPGEVRPTYAYPGVDTEAVLRENGFADDEIAALADNGTVAW